MFGLDREEFDCLRNAGLKIKPSKFEKSEDRFQVKGRADFNKFFIEHSNTSRFTAPLGQS